jgi:hypothetical protein
MEYVHIPTGVRVTSDVELPAALYKKVDEKPKRTASKRTAKPKE